MRSVVLAVAVTLAGCDVNLQHGGPVEHESHSIELDKSEMVRVEITMGAGEITVSGGSPNLLDADFDYNVPSWKPTINYTSGGFRGQLNISQPHGTHTGGNAIYKWNLRFNDKVPLDMVTHLGAGEARLNLGSVVLRSLNVNMGVGAVRLDLRGKPDRDYSVEINGGVGQATVYLPRDVGVIANAAGGIGEISVRGLEKHNGNWINPAREHSPVTIHVSVHGGVGQIQLIAE